MSKVGLPYWKALVAFSLTEEEVWTNQAWRLKFPDVYERLDVLMDSPVPEMGEVWIPHIMLVEMAKKTRLFFGTNGEWLMSTIDKADIPIGYEEISALEAMERYGLEHVFEAADKASSRVRSSE